MASANGGPGARRVEDGEASEDSEVCCTDHVQAAMN
jgi:hypothetical protein